MVKNWKSRATKIAFDVASKYGPGAINQAGKYAYKLALSADERRRAYQNARSSQKTRQPRSISKRGMITTARSGGFMKPKKSVRKFKRKTVEGRLLRTGVSHTIETGRVITNAGGTTNQLFGVGHGTCPQAQIETMMWQTVLKKLIAKAGVIINSSTDIIPTFATDIIEVRYRVAPGAAQQFTNVAIPLNATLDSLTDLMTNASRLWYANNPNKVEFVSMIYRTPTFNQNMHTGKVEFFGCNVQMYFKSTLKIQNRSVTATVDNEADDVNNVPLYGKTYEGKGTGVNYIIAKEDGTIGGSFVIDGLYGNMIPIGTNNVTGIDEPPPASVFDGVKKYGKVRLEPGSIKTSSLVHKQTIGFNKLWGIICLYRNTPATIASSTVINGIGKYRFFMLEKMIDCTDLQPMSMAMEHNLYMVFNSTFRESQHQIAKFTKLYQ